MAQGVDIRTTLATAQEQRLAVVPQKVLAAKLTEMSLAEFEDAVRGEMQDNESVEQAEDELRVVDGEQDSYSSREQIADDILKDREDGDDSSHSDSSLQLSMGRGRGESDMMPQIGESEDFQQKLRNQLNDCDVDDEMRTLVEYLIGSLDDDGLLNKDLLTLQDELEFSFNIFASAKQMEEALSTLQTFEPTGVGARNRQECLLLQLRTKPESEARDKAIEMLEEHYDDFMNKRWEKMPETLGVDEAGFEEVKRIVRRLNPKPGDGGNVVNQRIIPDFYVTIDEENDSVQVSLNNGEVPMLQVSESYESLYADYERNKDKMSLERKNELVVAKKKVDRAREFIEAIRSRKETMLAVMKAIVRLQHDYFMAGCDETELRPMILEDVAKIARRDISTVSRVVKGKYVQVDSDTIPLRFFFNRAAKSNEEGEDKSSREVESAIREIIAAENPKRPLSDEALTEELQKRGFDIARRTTSKYREAMGILTSRLRKEK